MVFSGYGDAEGLGTPNMVVWKLEWKCDKITFIKDGCG